MEELTKIIQQRRNASLQITKNNEQKHKFHLIEQQRKRNDRQNWILRVLKSLKLYSTQQKKVIYDITIKMMNNYKPTQQKPINFQSINFLELIINLFVQFFNKFDNMDFSHLKSIIRPNNNYIIVDLIKSLIDIGRKQFKITLQQHFKQQFQNQAKKLSVKSLIKLPGIKNKTNVQSQNYTEESIRISLDEKIIHYRYERYNKFIDNCNFQQIYQKANELYFDLLYANQRNSLKIQKYLDSCYGPKRHINYDATGLYTVQQIKKITKQQKQKATLRLSQIKQLKGQYTSQQFKQYFKMKVELHQATSSVPIFIKPASIQKWFPICLIKDGDKVHPYCLFVVNNGSYYGIDQFQVKSGKKIKVYLKELLQLNGQNINVKLLNQSDYIQFKKKNNMDHSINKILQLMNQQPPLKKQLLFPPINNSDQIITETRRKIKSQKIIADKSLMIPVKSSKTIQKQIEKRLNYSTIVKEINFGKRKIDTLIQHYVKFTK